MRNRPVSAPFAAKLNLGRTHADLEACRPRAATEGWDFMLTRRLFIIRTAAVHAGVLCTAAGAAGFARADDSPALTFVKAIYAAYKGKNTKGVAIDTDAQLRRYFEPSLADLIIKDRKDAAKHHDVPTLDGDPFIDAQDWEIKSFDITVNDTGSGKATSTVKFVNEKEPVTITLDLVAVAVAVASTGNADPKEKPNPWRISDITYLRDGKPETLRGLFKH
jgi:hypothetical protein